MKILSSKKRLSRYCFLFGRYSFMVACLSVSLLAKAASTDIQINSLISQAIETHPLVGSARSEQQATAEGIRAAKLNLLPAPSVTAGYDRDDELVSKIGIRQPIWTGGRLTANVNQAIFDDKAAVEHIYEQQNQVAKNTIEAWQSYIAAVEKQRVYLKNLEQLGEFEAMMQRRVQQGVSARIELDLVTNYILQEQNGYQGAAEQQRIAAARLEQITGHPISQGSALGVPNLDILVSEAKKQSSAFEQMAFNQASFHNPTVVKEYFQIESAKQEVKAKQATRYPTVYAQYEHAYYHKTKENDGKVSVGMTYEPGAGFSNLALARASQAHVDSLVQNQEAARRNMLENIQIQYQQFVSAKDKELSLEGRVSGNQMILSSYRRQFIAGRKSWNEVLNAVREHSDTQIQLVQTRVDLLGAFYKLQVDFGMMPWQKFAHNREPTKLFRPINQVKDWLSGQEKIYPKRSEPAPVVDDSYEKAMVNRSMEPVIVSTSAASIKDNAEQSKPIRIEPAGREFFITAQPTSPETPMANPVIVEAEQVVTEKVAVEKTTTNQVVNTRQVVKNNGNDGAVDVIEETLREYDKKSAPLE